MNSTRKRMIHGILIFLKFFCRFALRFSTKCILDFNCNFNVRVLYWVPVIAEYFYYMIQEVPKKHTRGQKHPHVQRTLHIKKIWDLKSNTICYSVTIRCLQSFYFERWARKYTGPILKQYIQQRQKDRYVQGALWSHWGDHLIGAKCSFKGRSESHRWSNPHIALIVTLQAKTLHSIPMKYQENIYQRTTLTNLCNHKHVCL